MHDAEILLQQDDLGRRLGHVRRAVDRDADVGGVQRRGVIDAIAQEADGLPMPLQQQDHPQLLLAASRGRTAALPPTRADRASSLSAASSVSGDDLAGIEFELRRR